MDNKTLSIVSYISIIGWVIAYVVGKDKADDLLKNHIIAIQKVGQRSFNLIVNTGNYYIELGTLNNFEQKLHNLKLFYNQYIDFIGTEDYEKLSLKFVNQVVATKRIKNGEQ